ncbi:MAG: MCP four helix bundle domain-containing protein, partial [Limnobacter sp.]|nr:MCP four helix bundle domain-containing protein [Limnobacter sp.]
MNWINTLTIRTKIVVLTAVLISASVLAGYFGISGSGQINEQADEMYQTDLLGLSAIKEANIGLLGSARAIRSYLLALTDPSIDAPPHLASLERFRGIISENLDTVRPLLKTEESKAKLKELEKSYATLVTLQDKALDLAKQEVERGLTLQKRESVSFVMNNVRTESDRVDDLMTEFGNLSEANAAKASQATTAVYENVRTLIVTSTLIGTAIGLLIGLYVVGSVNKTLGYVASALRRVSEGDLNV